MGSISWHGTENEREGFSPRRPAPLQGKRQPHLTVAQILRWADSHYARTNTWPIEDSGFVFENRNEKWGRISAALRLGLHGLEPGSSLARLLDRERGVRNQKALPPMTEAQIAVWAQAHFQRTRRWPGEKSGPIPETRDETWRNIEVAVRTGLRGLPGGDTLHRLLVRTFGAQSRQHASGVRTLQNLPRLSVREILGWADAHVARTGRWPKLDSGHVSHSSARKWSGVNGALASKRVRGLRAPCSLAGFLAKHRGVRNVIHPPRLSVRRILAWADTHNARTGQWPTAASGPIAQADGEKWSAIHGALKHGCRGLPGGSSLVRVLAKHRGVRNFVHPPRLTVRRILAWADEHYAQTGRWPRLDTGPLVGVPGEKWSMVNLALRIGLRGLPGGSSLAQLLARRRSVPIRPDHPRLSYAQILAWADAHFARTGRWPWAHGGAVADAPGETWGAIDVALCKGLRGLRGGNSVARLLAKRRRGG
ncbi:MAG: hypothetical protein HY040_29185 [Planctomycetes bacterium]|nr:hypothetical protein [Planctomycetota bacterium]